MQVCLKIVTKNLIKWVIFSSVFLLYIRKWLKLGRLRQDSGVTQKRIEQLLQAQKQEGKVE